jgi:hypothetical protein
MKIDTKSKHLNFLFRSFRTVYFSVLIGFIVTTSTISSVYSQTEPILNLQPFVNNDSLQLDVHYIRLFTGNIKKTLLAGLPILLELKLNLLDFQNKNVHSKKLSGKITYDVWEELFTIEGFDSVGNPLQSLDAVKQFFRNRLKTALLPRRNLKTAEIYQVSAESQVILLTREQSRHLQDWIQSSDQTEEELPTQERDTGFRLNLNNLVQLFMGSRDEQERYVIKASSRRFRLNDLANR